MTNVTFVLSKQGWIINTGEQGFEPQLTDPETAVLPLDDSPTYKSHITLRKIACQIIGQQDAFAIVDLELQVFVIPLKFYNSNSSTLLFTVAR